MDPTCIATFATYDSAACRAEELTAADTEWKYRVCRAYVIYCYAEGGAEIGVVGT